MIQNINSLLVLSIFFNSLVSGQSDSSGFVRYTPEFKLNEGIYINFEQALNNRPVPKSRIISSVAYDDPYFFTRILESKEVYFYDSFGVKQEIQTRKIWGYSNNKSLFVNINDGFYRVNILGNICHFVANHTSYNNNYYYPYSYYDYRYYPYGSRSSAYSTTEMRQYLLDFKTGNILDYNVTSIELLLMRDPELHDEYVSLKKRKKKQLKFLYIRRFNERNPLYFPVK